MKRVLITGANSYVGSSFMKYLGQWPEDYQTAVLDTLNEGWKDEDFSCFDVVLDVAAFVHKREKRNNKNLFYAVNQKLTRELAYKAKNEKVPQFIFLSTMNVYGRETGAIRKDTPPLPKSAYGISKLIGEEELRLLSDGFFHICIVRPPMVYGKNCKGNFQTLIRLVKLFPVMPNVKNRRSLIYIDNLCEFLKRAIDDGLDGTFFPQNSQYMSTRDMMEWIAEQEGKRIYFSILLGAGIKLLMPFMSVLRKGFGSLVYEDLDEFNYAYCVRAPEESVKESL